MFNIVDIYFHWHLTLFNMFVAKGPEALFLSMSSLQTCSTLFINPLTNCLMNIKSRENRTSCIRNVCIQNYSTCHVPRMFRDTFFDQGSQEDTRWNAASLWNSSCKRYMWLWNHQFFIFILIPFWMLDAT